MRIDDWLFTGLVAGIAGAAALVVGMLAIDFFLMDSSVLRDLLQSAWRW